MKKVLITGITGFVGSHLAEYYINQPDTEVWGTIKWRTQTENIEHIKDLIKWKNCDIVDSYSVYDVVNSIRPDVIHHLAAMSFVPHSWVYPQQTASVNIIGSLNFLEAVKRFTKNCVIQVASSSEVYGIQDVLPITEENLPKPNSPYAVSKLAMDRYAAQYNESFGVKTVVTRSFNHSVSKWTPVILKDDNTGLIDIKYISEIRCKMKKDGYLSGKIIDNDVQIWDMERHNLSVWSDDGWQKIKHISCHPIRDNKLLKICSRASVYDVTDNHSILDETGQEVSAGKCVIGDKILLSDLPSTNTTSIPDDLAWLYGFFAAEGCICNQSFRIDNNDKSLLDRCVKIIEKYLCEGAYYRKKDEESNIENNTCLRLKIRNPYKLSKQFRELFYASDDNKKIPKIILNSDKKTKLEFLRGFNAGDGLVNGWKTVEEFSRFTTKSPILAMGLCFLIENTTKQRYCINIEHRDDEHIYYGINLNSRFNKTLGKHLSKSQNEIKKIIELKYDDEVWDFETENHHFHCGIGEGIVHNTGPRRGEEFVCSSFAKQIAEIEVGKKQPIIKVGNLAARRDFTDVRDIVNAYVLAVDSCEYGTPYNIATEKMITIQEVLDILLSMSSVNIVVEKDEARMRPSDLHTLKGCAKKFRDATGWEPTIELRQTLEDLLDYWRDRV